MELEIQYPKKIAAVFGGLYAEHDVSIFSFKNFYLDIQSAGTAEDIELSSIYYIKRNGKVVVSSVDLKKPAEFYFNSESTTSYSLMDAFSMIKENNEFVYLICDGSIGIDGRFTSIAQNYALKGTFGSSLSFGICRSKFHLNQFVGTNYSDIKIPNTVYITCVEELEKAFTAFENQRIIVKPNSLGSSIYTMMFQCYKQNHGTIKDLVEKILEYDRWAIIQEYIQGEEYGCYCMEKDGTVDILATKQFEKKIAFLSTQDKYKVIEKSHDVFLKEEIGKGGFDRIDEIRQLLVDFKNSEEILEELTINSKPLWASEESVDDIISEQDQPDDEVLKVIEKEVLRAEAMVLITNIA
ncbi:MAG: hypothetical protein KKE12_10905, partial [Proteobacteria bacterium]|nr:hypothetical protein [Pseudomonadota bacterium]